MAYNIVSLESVPPDSHECYFFDANVWIAVLEGVGTSLERYVNFFEAIVALNQINDPKALKKLKFKPQIAMTDVLMSEIVNTYLRQVAMNKCFSNTTGKSFKADYRGTEHYSVQLQLLKDNIFAFQEYLRFFPSPSDSPIEILGQISSNNDYNDLYYYYLCLDNNIPIVTHDKDFLMQDIKVVTNNTRLLGQ